MVEISFNQVSHSFGSREILRQLTCSFHGGLITSVAGGNGSGKSTLLRLAGRLILPTKGKIETALDGKSICGADYRRILAMATPEMELYTRLSVRENLTFFLSARGICPADGLLGELLERVGLPSEVLPRMAGELSTGMRQRVRLAVLLGADAPVWLLDEPGLALDVHGRQLLTAEARRAAERGRLILWATNEPEERKAADACIDLTDSSARCC